MLCKIVVARSKAGRRCLGAAFVLALANHSAAAEVELAVDCPPLSSEQRASLEARAQADLRVDGSYGERWKILCDARNVTIERSGPARNESAGFVLGNDERRWVDEILGGMRGVRDAQQVSAPTAAFPPEPLDAVPSPPTAPAAEPEPRRAAASRARTRRVATPIANGGLLTRQLDAGGVQPAMAVAGCFDVWATGVVALLGPCASLGVRFGFPLRVALASGLQVGSSHPREIGARQWFVGAEGALGRTLQLRVGLHVAGLRFEAPRSLSPSSRATLDPALKVQGGYGLPLPGGRLSLIAGFRTVFNARDVNVDGERAFRVPLIAAAFAVEYALEVGGGSGRAPRRRQAAR